MSGTFGVFTDAYEDELVYSQLARYFVRTGYISYKAVANELFQNSGARPHIEYFIKFTPEALEAITRHISLEDVIMKHTMYPYYARFYSKEVKKAAFEDLMQMGGGIRNMLTGSLRRYGEDRFLRYCPMCLKEDKEMYGESYWHRTHQLPSVIVCPKHHCYLCNSTVLINGTKKLSLISAGEELKDVEEPVYSTNNVEKLVAKYITDVFLSDFDMESDGNVGRFLHSKLANTNYLSPRGQNRKLELLAKDFNEFYASIDERRAFCEAWQLQNVFTGRKKDANHICLLSIFLNIGVDELLEMKLPEKTQDELFDERLFALKEEGKTCAEIAEILNVRRKVVQLICNDQYFYRKPVQRKAKAKGAKVRDWVKVDEQTLPLVKTKIEQMRGTEYNKPHRITFNAIERELNLTSGQIRLRLPMCRDEILKQQEPIEKYWARKIIWAVRTLEREGATLNWHRITSLAGMRKKDFAACFPYLQNMIEEKMLERLRNILNSLSKIEE